VAMFVVGCSPRTGGRSSAVLRRHCLKRENGRSDDCLHATVSSNSLNAEEQASPSVKAPRHLDGSIALR